MKYGHTFISFLKSQPHLAIVETSLQPLRPNTGSVAAARSGRHSIVEAIPLQKQAMMLERRRRRVTARRCSSELLLLWRTVILVVLFQSSNGQRMAVELFDSNATASPTTAPNNNSTATPTVPSKNATIAPTVTPPDKNATQAPTPSSNTTTDAPAPANPTEAPTIVPPATTGAPTMPPSKSPVPPPPHDDDDNHKTTDQHGFSIWRMLAKTLAYLILLFLSILAFGAIMNHRYRIYYFLRGVWYTVLSLECTQWCLTKIGVRHATVDPMNTVVFDDNEMSYGLLMQENE